MYIAGLKTRCKVFSLYIDVTKKQIRREAVWIATSSFRFCWPVERRSFDFMVNFEVVVLNCTVVTELLFFHYIYTHTGKNVENPSRCVNPATSDSHKVDPRSILMWASKVPSREWAFSLFSSCSQSIPAFCSDKCKQCVSVSVWLWSCLFTNLY